MKLAISGAQLAQPLVIELTDGETSVMDGPALNRSHAVAILEAWKRAPVAEEDDTVREWILVGADGGAEEMLTVMHRDGALHIARWPGQRGYYIADWPFGFEWALTEDPPAPVRLPIEQRVPYWNTLNPQARKAIESHDSVLTPDAWFRGVHDGRVLEYLAACNSGADGDSSTATMVSIVLDFTSHVALEVSTRELHDGVWTTGYEA